MDESSVKCVAMFELSWAHYKRVQRIVSELIAFIGAEIKSVDFHFETQKKKKWNWARANGKNIWNRADRAPSRLIGARRTASYFTFHLLRRAALSLAVLAGHWGAKPRIFFWLPYVSYTCLTCTWPLRTSFTRNIFILKTNFIFKIQIRQHLNFF